MSNVDNDKDIEQVFRQESRSKLIHYAEANTAEGLKRRLLNLIDEGFIEFGDVKTICEGKPEECVTSSNNFGLGDLDDNRDLLLIPA